MDAVCFVDGKKLMWDGRTYESLDAATAARQAYEADGFTTHLVQEGDNFFVYSRRVAAQTSEAPAAQ